MKYVTFTVNTNKLFTIQVVSDLKRYALCSSDVHSVLLTASTYFYLPAHKTVNIGCRRNWHYIKNICFFLSTCLKNPGRLFGRWRPGTTWSTLRQFVSQPFIAGIMNTRWFRWLQLHSMCIIRQRRFSKWLVVAVIISCFLAILSSRAISQQPEVLELKEVR